MLFLVVSFKTGLRSEEFKIYVVCFQFYSCQLINSLTLNFLNMLILGISSSYLYGIVG